MWGNPFYTKLAMAAAGNRAPDLAVRMGRVTGFAPGRLLDAWEAGLLGADDRIVPVTSTDDWFGVLKEAKKSHGRTHGKTWLAYYYDAADNGTPKLGRNQLSRRSDWPVPK